ncbi:MAG: response regulator [Candidatus Eisenbacteria bacterium]|nr:response regulator [Candidatus Eisenbacteria bacterium]
MAPNNQKILVADDEAYIRELVRAKLENVGYDVEEASTGREAIELAKNSPPDLILLDIMMPDFDGFETCRYLREDERTKTIPVIFLSQKRQEQDIVRGLELGAVDYLTKPFSPRELAARVRIFLSGKGVGAQTISPQEVKTPEGDLASVLQISKVLLSPLKLRDKLAVIVNMASRFLGANILSLRTTDPETGEFKLGASLGLSDEYLKTEVEEVVRVVGGRALNEKKPVAISNAQEDAATSNFQSLKLERLNSVLCLPVLAPDKLLGIFTVYGKTAYIFSEREIKLFSLLADQAALAIETDSLHDSLISANRKLSMFLSNAPSAILVGNLLGIVQFSSLIASRIVGKEENELIGMKLEDLEVIKEIFPEKEVFSKVFEEVKAGGSFSRIMRIGGNEYELLLKALQEKGASIGFICILFSVSDQRRRERAEEEFIFSIAHEMQIPMTALKGFSEILLEEKLDEASIKRYLDIINKETTRLANLINDLSQSTRLSAGTERLRLSPTDLSSVLQDVIVLLKGRLGTIRFETSIPPNLARLIADKEKMKEVFTNILDNAIKYTLPGGRILVSMTEQPEEILVTFEDSGVGMTGEEQARIFDRFYRAEKPGFPETKGTGLGLTIAKQLVELHKGRIWAESEPGKGSKFFVALPKVHTHQA